MSTENNAGGEDPGKGGGGDPAAPGAAGASGEWTPPESLPEDFRGADPAESLEKLLGGYTAERDRANGLRDKLSKLPAVPKEPGEYAFEPTDKTKPFFGDEQAPFLDLAKQAAHAAGVPGEAFGQFVNGFYEAAADQGLVPEPFSPEKEIKGYMEASGLDRETAAKQLEANDTFAKGLAAQITKSMPEGVRPAVEAHLTYLTETQAGNLIIEALAKRFNEGGIRIAGEANVHGELTEAEAKKLTADPRIDPANREHPDPEKRFDPELRKRYDAFYEKRARAKA